MAELNQHDEIAGGVDRGAFYAVMSAMASRDPKRVALAECDAFTALQSIGSMLNVVADYLYLRKLFKTPISERWGKQICLNE